MRIFQCALLASVSVSARTGLLSCWLFCLLFCSPIAVFAANISVETELNPVIGEEFTLVFSSDEQPAGNPDFSPLKQDFEILSTATSTNIQIINGVASKEFSWRLQALPKTSGTVEIPAIQFGNDASPVTTIVVGKESTGRGGVPKDGIIVELESNIDAPFVQQQILVTQRLLHVVSLRNTGATMSHPTISEGNALIQQLGGITNKTLLRNGIQYTVSERLYAIFPQASGKLVLGRTVFQGIIDDGRKRRDPFGMSGRQVRRFSAPLELEVKEQPALKGVATWLPANSLSISAHWQVPPDQLKTGEPVTLTLAVIADGLMAEQLPELKVKPPKGVKGYSNQPEFTNNSNGSSVLGTRQEKWILIGTAPGEYKLPEIWLNWWNLATGKLEVASVPETVIKVTGAVPSAAQTEATTPESLATAQAEAEAEQSASSTAADKADSAATSEALISSEKEGAVPDSTDVVDEKPAVSLLWIGLGAGLAVLLAGLMWWFKKKRAVSSNHTESTSIKVGKQHNAARNRVDPLDLLEKACKNDEPQKAYDALSDWVKQDLQLSPATLSQLRKEADFTLKQALDDLSMTLYSVQHDGWQGAELWQAVMQHEKAQFQAKAGKSGGVGGLLSLYPE